MDKSNGGMGGKTVLITGGTSGIGKAAAVALAAMGAKVVIVGRNQERGGPAVEEIRARSHNESVELMLADLSVQAEVRGLAEEFQERHDRLDVLANNAGLVQSKRTETPDGIETTLATMFTYELAERLNGTGVSANCLHPGSVGTNFGQNNRGPVTLFFRTFKPFMRSPEKGADTLIWLASSPEVDGVSGKYFSDRKEIEAKSVAYDRAARRRLWEVSEKLTGLKVAA